MRSTALADITRLLDAEREARQRKKRRRNAQQVQAELRMYARYVNEQRRHRREADYRHLAAARQQEQNTELKQERAGHRARVGQLLERGKHIPTHAEMREQEEQDRRGLQIYYAGLFAEREMTDQSRGETKEIER